MKQKNRILVLALSGALLLGGAGSVKALSGDQESACGAILCLAGGAGVGACAPYLARYFAITAPNPTKLFERRLDFLNLCPAPGMPGDVRPLLARYGATCQPATLVSRLNAQIQACEMRDPDNASACQPSGNEWRVCASFYGHGYTAYDAPELHEACARVRGADGYLVERCAYGLDRGRGGGARARARVHPSAGTDSLKCSSRQINALNNPSSSNPASQESIHGRRSSSRRSRDVCAEPHELVGRFVRRCRCRPGAAGLGGSLSRAIPFPAGTTEGGRRGRRCGPRRGGNT